MRRSVLFNLLTVFSIIFVASSQSYAEFSESDAFIEDLVPSDTIIIDRYENCYLYDGKPSTCNNMGSCYYDYYTDRCEQRYQEKRCRDIRNSYDCRENSDCRWDSYDRICMKKSSHYPRSCYEIDSRFQCNITPGCTFDSYENRCRKRVSTKRDACGCRAGEGWSTSKGRCAPGSVTDSNEAAMCRNPGGVDACGCRAGEGWSTSKGRCAPGSVTDSNEAAMCRNPGGVDACGCRAGEGWSTSKGRCAPGSVTDSNEAAMCRN